MKAIVLISLMLVMTSAIDSFLSVENVILCAKRGENCDNTPCCGKLQCEDRPGVCIGNEEELEIPTVENYQVPETVLPVLCAHRGENCDNTPCCGKLQCEDRPGVCVGNDEFEVETFVCAPEGGKCGGLTENGFFCCPGFTCEGAVNGEAGVCVKQHTEEILCAHRGENCDNTPCCGKLQCEDRPGVCVGNDEVEEVATPEPVVETVLPILCAHRGENCDNTPCCGKLQCEDRPGVCVGNDEFEVVKTENIVCSPIGGACGGVNENAWICCPGSECEDNFNGHGVCVRTSSVPKPVLPVLCAHRGENCDNTPCCGKLQCEDRPGVCVGNDELETFVCAPEGGKCGGVHENGFICCPGYQCEDNFGGFGVCVKA